MTNFEHENDNNILHLHDLFMLGLSHHTAPVEVREKVAIANQDLPDTLQLLVRPDDPYNSRRHLFSEGVIVSTCNRTEIYIQAEPQPNMRQLLEAFLQEVRATFADSDLHRLYFRTGSEVVRHLFHVASGLDSMILGEPQILGQVKESYRIAKESGFAGTMLSRLFDACVNVARRVRTETVLGEGAVSVAYATVELAQKVFTNLSNREALLIGAGETGQLTAKYLREKGIRHLYITNRTLSKAEHLAAELEGTAVPFDRYIDVLNKVDMVIGATGAPTYNLTHQQLKPILTERADRALLLIDIGMPRDFDPTINTLDNVFLYDIGSLEQIVKKNLEKRAQEVPRAEKIIEEELEKFENWRHSLKVTPTIIALRRQFEEVRQVELEKHRHRVGEEEFAHLDRVTRGLINKLLHPPTTHLKKFGDGHHNYVQAVALVRELFGLEDLRHEAKTTDRHEGQPIGVVANPLGAEPVAETVSRR